MGAVKLDTSFGAIERPVKTKRSIDLKYMNLLHLSKFKYIFSTFDFSNQMDEISYGK